MLHYLFRDCEFTFVKYGQVTEILSVNGLDTLEGVQGLEKSNKGHTCHNLSRMFESTQTNVFKQCNGTRY